jgi:hypothetical protein
LQISLRVQVLSFLLDLERYCLLGKAIHRL